VAAPIRYFHSGLPNTRCARTQAAPILVGTYCSRPVMEPTPVNSEKKAANVIWIGTIVFVFTIGAMIFGD
jgi:hypothetical protein